MGFWVETKTPKSWLMMTSSWWCTPPLNCQNSTFASIAESVHWRLMKVVRNDSPTPVSYPYLMHCFALTSNVLCYDVIIANVYRKLRMVFNVEYFLPV